MKRWCLFVVLVLLAASLACSLAGTGDSDEAAEPGGAAEPAAPSDDDSADSEPDEPAEPADSGGSDETADSEEPADSGESEEPGEADEPAQPSSGSADDLSGLNSYRARTTWRSEHPDGTVEALTIDEALTRNPFAFHQLIVEEREGGETIEIYRVGEIQYVRVGTDWVQTQGELISFEDNQTILYFMDYSAMIESGEFDELGGEKVNGVQTRHYRQEGVSTDEMDYLWVVAPRSSYGFSDDEVSFESYSYDLWIADDPDFPAFPVRTLQTAEGTNSNGAPVSFFDEREIYDINSSFTIEPPADASAGWPPDDVPVYPGVTVDSASSTPNGGVMFYTTPDDVETVAEYFNEELPAADWSQFSSNVMTGMVMDIWQKDNRTITLLISTEAAGGCSVTLTEGTEQ